MYSLHGSLHKSPKVSKSLPKSPKVSRSLPKSPEVSQMSRSLPKSPYSSQSVSASRKQSPPLKSAPSSHTHCPPAVLLSKVPPPPLKRKPTPPETCHPIQNVLLLLNISPPLKYYTILSKTSPSSEIHHPPLKQSSPFAPLSCRPPSPPSSHPLPLPFKNEPLVKNAPRF